MNTESSPAARISGGPGPGGISCTACLLVGGASSRMGTDKATLCIAGEPLWSRQLTLLHTLQPQRTLISSRSVPNWRPVGLEVLLDRPPSRGPLSGIWACLQHLETTHLIVLAIDMPRMTAEHLRKLIALAQPGRSLIPQNRDYFEPTCAVYAPSAAPFAAAALAAKDASLQCLSRALIAENVADSYPLKPEERPFYYNLNQPGDFAALLDPQAGT